MECSICLNGIIDLSNLKHKEKITTLDCGHKFHLECILNLDKKCCPNCRQEIKLQDLCPNNHNTMFYAAYHKKNGTCRICYKKNFKYYMLQKTK